MENITAESIIDTINQLHKEEKTGRCISYSKRKQYVDNINILLDIIYSWQKNDDGKIKVQLTSSIIIKYLSRNHYQQFKQSLEILGLLKETTSTVINNGMKKEIKYKVGAFAKSYELFGQLNKLNNGQQLQIEETKELYKISDIYNYYHQNYDVKLIQANNFDFIKHLYFQFKDQKKTKIVNTVDSYVDFRFYHTLTQLKSYEINNLYYGEVTEKYKVMSLDIASSNFSVITNVELLRGIVCDKTLAKLKKVNTDKLKELAKAGEIYMYLHNKFKEEYPTNKIGLESFKKALIKDINKPKPANTNIIKCVRKHLPEILELSSILFDANITYFSKAIKNNEIIDNFDKKNHAFFVGNNKKFSYLYNAIENKIITEIIKKLINKSIPCATKHDSVLFISKDIDIVKEVIKETEDMYNIKFK